MIISRPLVGKICDNRPLSWISIPGFIAEMAACVPVSNDLGYACDLCGCGVLWAWLWVNPGGHTDYGDTFCRPGTPGRRQRNIFMWAAILAWPWAPMPRGNFNAAGSMVMYLFMAGAAVLSTIFYAGYKGKSLAYLTRPNGSRARSCG